MKNWLANAAMRICLVGGVYLTANYSDPFTLPGVFGIILLAWYADITWGRHEE